MFATSRLSPLMNFIFRILLIVLPVATVASGANLFGQEATPVEFNRDIRPILSDNCYACHGPDENQRQTEFRLDIEHNAMDDLGGYFAIDPGKPDNSELIRRISSSDPDEIMPPADHRKHLTAAEKDLLRRWIAEGAKWQGHWAWTSPRNSEPPEVKDPSWPANYVDHYILERLDANGIEPSKEADRITLIRRLNFDLTGLPPSPDEVDLFVNDQSDDAWEQLVERLLASPHFGERLAIYWLDLVRYADTVGYHGDQEISISPFRDYVIESFNSNMPFDRFTREQLAGDLLGSPTDDQLIASGYNRLGMMSAEGGVQPEEYLTKYAADRVRTTASVWLGATLGCAECHDHKFDPFTSSDFYSFGSFFSDITERGLYSGANESGDWGPKIDVPDPELPELLLPIDRELAELRDSMTAPPEVLASDQQEWEADIRDRTFEWHYLLPATIESYHETAHKVLDDHSILMTGERTDEDCYVITVDLPAGIHRGLRLEARPHKSLPKLGPGRAGNGNFVVTQLLVLRDDFSGHMKELKQLFDLWDTDLSNKNIALTNASATFEQIANKKTNPYGKWTAESAIDHDRKGSTYGWAVLPEAGRPNELVVNFDKPIELEHSAKFTVVLHQYHGAGGHVLGRFRLSTTNSQDAVANPFRSLPGNVAEFLNLPKKDRNDEQAVVISEYFFSITPRFKPQREKIAGLEQQRKEVVNRHTRTSLITVAAQPREMRVLPRGNWMDKSGPVVHARVPELLGGSSHDPAKRLTRLDLANWITDSDNPLTARAFVNRLWMLYFGTGLSKVLDDLGSQGEWPSHPNCLTQWLSISFSRTGTSSI